jgi:hypothetical protein
MEQPVVRGTNKTIKNYKEIKRKKIITKEEAEEK